MVLLRYLRHHLKPDVYGEGYKGLLLQGLNEAPWYVFSIPIFLLCGLAYPFKIRQWNKMEGQKRRFMYKYTILRPEDPQLDKFFYIDVRDKSNIIDSARKTYYDD